MADEGAAPRVALTRDEVDGLATKARRSAENGRLDEALSMLQGLVILEPANSYLHTCLGCVLMQLDKVKEARESFETALSLDPRDLAALTYAGELAFEAGDVALALTRLDEAIALDPDGRNLYANRARTLRPLAEAASAGARPGAPVRG